MDIFALGLILCEMCCKFKTLHERIDTLNNLKYKGLLPETVRQNYPTETEIILMMTRNDPSQRPSAAELQKSPLLEQWGKQILQSVSSVLSPGETMFST